MSHIFDALQRAETDRSGVKLDDFTLANELLRIAEAEVVNPAAEPQAPPLPSTPAIPELNLAEARLGDAALPPRVNVFDQFETLPLVLPPHSKLVSVTDKDSLAAEKFRFLAVRLRQLQQNRHLKKLLITSTIPEEGKTMVSANLACTLARRKQQKALLLEGDLRRPNLARQFGLGRVPGMSEHLQGEADVTRIIYRLDALGLWILPAGKVPQNPLELMQAGKLSPLMEQLSSWFDWIVIDSPPVLPLADTSIWMRVSDGVLLVTRPGKTEKHHLERGIEAVDQAKLLGALINSSANVTRSDYYYQHRAYDEQAQAKAPDISVPASDPARS